MITFKQSGKFIKTSSFLSKASNLDIRNILRANGQSGVLALSKQTPIDTGETAKSWSYRIKKTRNGYSLTWHNSSEENGIPIVILLQYGHATRGGTYIPGVDFINPAIKPILERISEKIWTEVNLL